MKETRKKVIEKIEQRKAVAKTAMERAKEVNGLQEQMLAEHVDQQSMKWSDWSGKDSDTLSLTRYAVCKTQFQGSGFVVPYGKKKYKPVAKKVKPIKATLPSEFRIE
uniref:Uncharacterized protein n=1 Tax=Moniliophthora roreri TaxID=221103 RepID=A0A0W0FWN1_MONRR